MVIKWAYGLAFSGVVVTTIIQMITFTKEQRRKYGWLLYMSLVWVLVGTIAQ